MSDKHEIQILTCNKIGAMLDDLLEGCQRELHEMRGTLKAMAVVKANIQKIIDVTKEELVDAPPAVATPAMRAMARVQESMESFTLQCKTWEIAAIGKIQATEAAVTIVKKECDSITAKNTDTARSVRPEGSKLLHLRKNTEDTPDASHT